VKKGKSKRRDIPATKEVEGGVVIEVNLEEWFYALCEAVIEDMVCCQHCEK
jgi:hypothetical protein